MTERSRAFPAVREEMLILPSVFSSTSVSLAAAPRMRESGNV